MKSKYKKERRKIFFTIMSLLLIVCVLVTGAYCLLTVENTKNILVSSGQTRANDIFLSFSQKLSFADSKLTPKDYNLLPDRRKNEFIKIINYENNLFAKSQNSIRCNFHSKKATESAPEPEFNYELLYYDDLRGSMNDAQYNKIIDYLTQPQKPDGTYYELICTEFFVNAASTYVVPTKLEVVKTKADHGWYVQDTVIERFKLTPNVSLKKFQKQITGEMHRNVIPLDFLLEEYNVYDLENITNNANNKAVDLQQLSLFEYGFFTQARVANKSTDDSNKKNYVLSYGDIDGLVYNAADIYYVQYCCKFNVLDVCLEQMIFVSLLILFFFILIGAILEISIIRTFNHRIKQEEKRIEMTNAFAHNMKTPLYIINGFVENLKRTLDTDKKEHYIDVIQAQTVEMDELVKRMLDFSRLDSGEIKINRSSFMLDDLLCEVLEKYESLSDKNIKVESDSVEITADRELLKLTIENLVENAIKYSDDNDINILIKNNNFEISNCCKGITDRDIKKLWQPYFRKNNNSEKGNGIGLSIVKAVLDLHKFKYGTRLNNNKITFWFRY